MFVTQTIFKSYDVFNVSKRLASVPEGDTFKIASHTLNYETTFKNCMFEKYSESTL